MRIQISSDASLWWDLQEGVFTSRKPPVVPRRKTPLTKALSGKALATKGVPAQRAPSVSYTRATANRDPAMSDHETPLREYTRPPMLRGVDPQRMNWLWQLILQATDLKADEVREALNAMGVGATDKRLASWAVSDRAENYFPLTIAELERNLRAVIDLKKKREEAASDADAPQQPQE
jgi:hypothetical protein